jgi:hypothetical protein
MALVALFRFFYIPTIIQWNYHTAWAGHVADDSEVGRSARRTGALKTAAIGQRKLSGLYAFFMAASANFKGRQKTHLDEVAKSPRDCHFRFKAPLN